MKKIGHYFTFLIILLSIFSCSEDFKVGAPYKEVMVVYGLLNNGDSAHYIKITRGFFDEKTNNLLSAKKSDSIYYDSLQVSFSQLNQSGNVIQTYPLYKVDLKTEGYIKDTGIFVSQPAFAYKLKTLLNPGFNYKINITNPTTNKTYTSTTNLIDPNAFEILDLGAGSLLDLSDSSVTKDFIFTPPPGAAIVEMYLRFNYYQITTTNGNSVPSYHSVDCPVFTRQPTSGSNGGVKMTYIFNNNSKYGVISSGLPAAGPNVQRFVDTPDVIFLVGGVELKKYIDITNTQGGITSDQIKPLYSNILGGDVYGLFSTRAKQGVYQIPFTKQTIDDLISNDAIKNLRIVGRSPI